MNFQVKFNNDDAITYTTEEKFISDLFSLLIGNQFILSNLATMQENFLKALELVYDLISQQKVTVREIKPTIVVSKAYRKELGSYNAKLTKLANRIKQMEKDIVGFNNLLDLKKYVFGYILVLEKMSNLPGFILGDNSCKNTFGNSEIVSWTTRPQFRP